MRVRKEEQVKKNREFYCETYSTWYGRMEKIGALVYILLGSLAAFGLKTVMQRNFYIYEAGINGSGGVDTIAYANQKAWEHLIDWYTVAIVLGAVLLCLFIAVLHIGVKSYHIYRWRIWLTYIPAAIFGIECAFILLGLWWEFHQQGLGFAYPKLYMTGFVFFLNFLPMILGGRLIVTWEARECTHVIAVKILDLLTDLVLEKFLG